MNRPLRSAVTAITISAAILAGVTRCATTSEGIDLSVRGGLEVEVYELPGTVEASVRARIVNTLGGPRLLLTSDQSLTVNGSGLSINTLTGEYATTLPIAATYEVVFTDKGTSRSATATQRTPLDSITVTPGEDTATVAWSPTGEPDVIVDVLIDNRQTASSSDAGSLTLDAEDLDDLDPGAHTITVRRYRTEDATDTFRDLLRRATLSVGRQRATQLTIPLIPEGQ